MLILIFFSYISGVNETWRNSGFLSEIGVDFKQKRNTPWSSTFIHGFYMPYSYKRIVRRWFLGFEPNPEKGFDLKKDRILIMNYFVKLFVFPKTLNNSINSAKITTSSFFFNRNFSSRILLLKQALNTDLFLKKFSINRSHKKFFKILKEKTNLDFLKELSAISKQHSALRLFDGGVRFIRRNANKIKKDYRFFLQKTNKKKIF